MRQTAGVWEEPQEKKIVRHPLHAADGAAAAGCVKAL